MKSKAVVLLCCLIVLFAVAVFAVRRAGLWRPYSAGSPGEAASSARLAGQRDNPAAAGQGQWRQSGKAPSPSGSAKGGLSDDFKAVSESGAKNPGPASAAHNGSAGPKPGAKDAQKKLKAAIEEYEQKLAQDPSDRKSLFGYLRALRRGGKDAASYDRAIDFFKGLIEQRPDEPNLDARYNLGTSLVAKCSAKWDEPIADTLDELVGYGNKALEAFTYVIEHDPDYWQARFATGYVNYHYPGRVGQSTADFQALIDWQEQSGRTDPEFVYSYIWAGNAYLKTGDTQAAAAAYERGLQMFPGNEELANKLASLSEQGK